MSELYDRIDAATSAIRKRWDKTPTVGIILGTGLNQLAEDLTIDVSIPYNEVPGFLTSTAPSHKGTLTCGELAGKTVMVMEGRFHFYEGYSLQEITFPVRVMKAMGCEVLIASNACGGMNPQYQRGDIMVIEDHINLLGSSPLIGPNDDRLGVRFPDMLNCYDPELVKLTREVALKNQLSIHQGVYVAVTGPNLETKAEYRFLRAIGADVVGMSTVPEVIVGVHSGMRNLGLSVVTDMCLPDALEPVSMEEIIAAANAAEPKLRMLVHNVIGAL